MPDYIHINRRFSTHAGEHNIVAWPEILPNSCSLILARGGSGKTAEFKNQVKELKNKGKIAFYFELKKLTSLSPADEQPLIEWCQSTSDQHAYFFLDSVDECKLQSIESFRLSLLYLARIIHPKINLAHIFISSRGIAVQQEDKDTISDFFTNPKNSESKEFTEVSTYYLLPFEHADVRSFIEKYVDDLNLSTDILKKIKDYKFEEFTQTPLDLIFIIKGIQKASTSHKEPTRLDIIEYGIEGFFDETSQLRTSRELSFEQFKTYIKKLAFSLLFSQQSIFQIPSDFESETYLNVRKILPSLSDTTFTQLFSTKIFTTDSGQAKFINREIPEFLCAQFIYENDKSYELFSTFFNERFNIHVTNSSKQGILSWLIVLDSKKYQPYCIKWHPEIFFNGGDFRLLALEKQNQVLSAFAEKLEENPNFHYSYDLDLIPYMFNDSEHGAIIQKLWKEYPQQATHYLLVRIINLAKINSCYTLIEPEIYKHEPHCYIDLNALQTKFDSDKFPLNVWEKLNHTEGITDYLLEEFVRRMPLQSELCPVFLDSIDKLSQSTSLNRYQIQNICRNFTHKISHDFDCATSLLTQLLQKLTDSKIKKNSNLFWYLKKITEQLFYDLVKNKNPSYLKSDSFVCALRLVCRLNLHYSLELLDWTDLQKRLIELDWTEFEKDGPKRQRFSDVLKIKRGQWISCLYSDDSVQAFLFNQVKVKNNLSQVFLSFALLLVKNNLKLVASLDSLLPKLSTPMFKNFQEVVNAMRQDLEKQIHELKHEDESSEKDDSLKKNEQIEQLHKEISNLKDDYQKLPNGFVEIAHTIYSSCQWDFYDFKPRISNSIQKLREEYGNEIIDDFLHRAEYIFNSTTVTNINSLSSIQVDMGAIGACKMYENDLLNRNSIEKIIHLFAKSNLIRFPQWFKEVSFDIDQQITTTIFSEFLKNSWKKKFSNE